MPAISHSRLPDRKIERLREENLHATIIEQQGMRELHLTIVPTPGEQFISMLERLNVVLKENGATIVRQQIFGPTEWQVEHLRLLKFFFGSVNWPVSWLQDISSDDTSIAGMHIQAIAGARVQTISRDGVIVGCTFDDGLARHLLLGGITPHDTFCSQASQTRQVYDQLEALLQEADMGFGDMIRTWFFLDHILDWYGDFNKVRNFVYAQKTKPFLPASTGVGTANVKQTALLLEAWAVQPLEGHMKISELKSPLQCAAPKYGSGFSRAVEIEIPGLRRVLISGTASIAEGGGSLHAGDFKKQIEETMVVVGAILDCRDQQMSDVTRATAYVKNKSDIPKFSQWCEDHHLDIPMVVTQADVCRDELLFEIEVDSIAVI